MFGFSPKLDLFSVSFGYEPLHRAENITRILNFKVSVSEYDKNDEFFKPDHGAFEGESEGVSGSISDGGTFPSRGAPFVALVAGDRK